MPALTLLLQPEDDARHHRKRMSDKEAVGVYLAVNECGMAHFSQPSVIGNIITPGFNFTVHSITPKQCYPTKKQREIKKPQVA